MVVGEAGIDAKGLVFVGEMGTNTSLVPLYDGWSRRGERALARVARKYWGANLALLLASMSAEGIGGPCLLAIEGSSTWEVLEAYLKSGYWRPRSSRGKW